MELRGLLNDRKKILPYTRRVAYAKAELVLAEKLGLIENAGIEALEKRCAEKNEENARLEMEKKGILRTAQIFIADVSTV